MENDENLQEPSLVEDVEVTESSTEPELQDEEATSEQATEKELPFHEHPRFKEVISEKNEYKQQVNDLQQKILDITEKISTPAEVKEDPYDGMDDNSRKWLKDRDRQVEGIADKVYEKKLRVERDKFQGELKTLRNAYGKLAADQFLKDNPDVKKGSSELQDIVNKAKEIGGNLEDAKKIIMFDSHAETAVQNATKKKQIKIKEKIAANVETSDVSQLGLKSEAEKSFEEAFAKAEKAAAE